MVTDCTDLITRILFAEWEWMARLVFCGICVRQRKEKPRKGHSCKKYFMLFLRKFYYYYYYIYKVRYTELKHFLEMLHKHARTRTHAHTHTHRDRQTHTDARAVHWEHRKPKLWMINVCNYTRSQSP